MDYGSKIRILSELEILIDPEDELPVKCVFSRADSKDYFGYNNENDFEDVIPNIESQLSEISDHVENLQVSDVNNEVNASCKEEIIETEYIIIDERETMAAMGLPTSFGTKKKSKQKRNGLKARIGKEDFATFIMPTLNEHCQIQTLESARPVIKKMGYFYENRTCKISRGKKCINEQQSDMDTSDGSDCEYPQILNKHLKSNPTEDKESQNEPNESLATDVVLNIIDKSLDEFDKDKAQIANIEIEKSRDCNGFENESLSFENTEDDNYSNYASAKSNFEDEVLDYNEPTLPKLNNKKRKNKRKHPMPQEIIQDKSLLKYYRKRYTLFSLYDHGIKLDREAWFSATPECIAKHTANRLFCDIIVDAFCGTGGNSIQFAKTCKKVIAIDIDPNKIEMAKNNASIYGVSDKIEFIVGDFIQLAPALKADTVFLSPPWGGPNYKSNTVYDLEKHLQPLPASCLFKLTQKITGNIAMYLPKNSNTNQLLILAGKGNRVELEQNFLYDRLTAITAYYGNLIKS